MQYGSIPGVTKPISRLAQGTATFFDPSDEAACFEMMDISTEFGINTFDTAHCYGEAKSVMFGKWLKANNAYDKLVILGKGAHPYDRDRVTPEDITSDLEATLKWMQTDYIDLFILHRDDPKVPVGPIVEILNKHKQDGKIGAFGGSNWTTERLQEAHDYAIANGLTPFAASSPNFSLAEQVEEPWGNCISISGPQGAAAREWYKSADIALFPWSSLAGGFFSNRFHRDNLDQFSDNDYFAALCKKCYCHEQNFQRLDRARELGVQKGLSVAQVALAFVMNHPYNLFALISCADRAQFEANTAAIDIKLTPQELDYLDLKSDSAS